MKRGGGNMVIDYVIGNKEVRERIERMEVGDRVESNHQPLIVKIRERDKEGGGKRVGGN